MSVFNGPVSLVLTSIAAPNAMMREMAAQCRRRGYSFFVIGDVSSPADFSLEGCEFYSLDRQSGTGFRMAELLPKRHYSRKNLGYLLAMHNRPQWILETDDDNLPQAGFWKPRQRQHRLRTLKHFGWSNIYAYYTDSPIWPRGLPLDAIQTPLPAFDSLPVVNADCPIQQGLANENPDVDAIYRLALPLPVRFDQNREIALGTGTWTPFNSQNTVWFPATYPLMYLPSYCSFRMTDIWRSFVAQRIVWENGWSLLFHGADVTQDRNDHSLMRDFTDEIPGYLHNRAIGQALDALRLEPGEIHLGVNLIRCYEELVRINVVGAEELPLVRAWVKDISTVMEFET